MRFFAAYWRKRALRKYARALPEKLRAGYGASEYYTPAQIKAATDKLQVDPELIVYGYATFLTEEAFGALNAQMPLSHSYQEARSEFQDHAPERSFQSSSFYESGIGLQHDNHVP
jgi:hypothetical protein